MPVASICMSTHNKPALLKRTLESIYVQNVPFGFETIVVDDGSKDDAIRKVCDEFPVTYHRIERPPVFRNPAVARNVAYKMAQGDVIIAQSDEVLHVTPNTIERLVRDLRPGEFLLANVFPLNQQGRVCGYFIGPERQNPLFFLGSVYRSDVYAIGGNDEDFDICPSCEDRWFGECLIYGLGLTPVFSTTIVGHHQWHTYCTTPEKEGPSRALLARKRKAAKAGEMPWRSEAGSWEYRQGRSYDE